MVHTLGRLLFGRDRRGSLPDKATARIIAVSPVDPTNQITSADTEFVGREVTPASDGTYRFENLSRRLLYTLMFSYAGSKKHLVRRVFSSIRQANLDPLTNFVAKSGELVDLGIIRLTPAQAASSSQ